MTGSKVPSWLVLAAALVAGVACWKAIDGFVDWAARRPCNLSYLLAAFPVPSPHQCIDE